MIRYRLTESKLRSMIKESIRQIIRENEMNNCEVYSWESNDPDWRIDVEYTCEFKPNGQIFVYSSLYGKESNVYTILDKTYDDYLVNGVLDTRQLEYDAEEEYMDFVNSLL